MKRFRFLLTLCLCLAGGFRAVTAQDNAARPTIVPQYSPQPTASRQADRPRSMQVVEFRGPASQTPQAGYFTVVGAVPSSQVFTSSEARIAVGDLIKAAGGLAPEASGSIRIVNQGRPRTQFIYGQDDKLAVYPGEIVVVVPRTTGPMASAIGPIIPVVCLGLDSRPVVLPLDQQLQSVPQLLHKLMQPPQIVSSIGLLQPLGLGNGELAPGTIIVFDRAAIDQNSLQTALKFNPLPETVRYGGSTETSLPRVTPGTPEALSTPSGTPAGIVVTPVPTPEMSAELPAPLEELPALAPPAESIASQPQPTPVEPLLSQVPSAPEPAALRVIPEPFVAEIRSSPVTTAAVVHEATPTSWIYRDEPQPTPAASRSPSQHADEALEPVSMEVIETEEGASAESNSGHWGLWAVISGVAMLACACFGLCVVWARWEVKAAAASPLASASPPSPAVAAGEPVASAGPAVETRPALEQLIDPALKVIEQPVAVLETVAVHGEPVGHRKMYVHEAHAPASGPHFLRSRATRTSGGINPGNERHLREQLRDQLKDIVRRQRVDTLPMPMENEAMPASDAAATATLEAVQPEYDVVQPEIVTTGRTGTLERVLRAHSREKRG